MRERAKRPQQARRAERREIPAATEVQSPQVQVAQQDARHDAAHMVAIDRSINLSPLLPSLRWLPLEDLGSYRTRYRTNTPNRHQSWRCGSTESSASQSMFSCRCVLRRFHTKGFLLPLYTFFISLNFDIIFYIYINKEIFQQKKNFFFLFSR